MQKGREGRHILCSTLTHSHLFVIHSVSACRGALNPLPSFPPAASPTVPAKPPSSVSSLSHSITSSLNIAFLPSISAFSGVFTKDYPPPLNPCKLPGPDERLISTQQLTLCLGLLQSSPLPDGGTLTPSARTWLNITENNFDEQERLKAMATDLIRAYTRDELKDTKVTTEVVCLAPVLEKEDYRILLSQLVDRIKGSLLLDVQALEGLTQLLKGASPGYLDADDLVRILKLLNTSL